MAGLTAGGDYVTKPFSIEEVVLRLRALLRHLGSDGRGAQLVVGDLVLDEDSHEVFAPANRCLDVHRTNAAVHDTTPSGC